MTLDRFRRERLRDFAVACGLGLAAVSCGAPPIGGQTSSASPDARAAVKLPSRDARTDWVLGAQLGGTLRADRASGCIWVEYVRGVGANVYWPEGLWLFFDPAPGRIEDAAGTVFAIVGEKIEMAGGSYAKDFLPVPAGCPEREDLWIVSAIG